MVILSEAVTVDLECLALTDPDTELHLRIRVRTGNLEEHFVVFCSLLERD